MLVLLQSVIPQRRSRPALQNSFSPFFRAVLGSLFSYFVLSSRVRLASHSLSSHFFKHPLIFPEHLRFSLISVIQTVKMHLFQKIFREKFCQFGKMQYLCTRFRKNGGKHRQEESGRKEFFDKIYINRKQQYKKQVRDHLGIETNRSIRLPQGSDEKRLLNKKGQSSRARQKNLQAIAGYIIKKFYNGEFDPGSG